jgi:hypothetical protein
MEATVPSFAQWLSVAKDVVLTLAAGVAMYVGVRGLNTWRRQLRGNTEYALAKSVLTSIYELRGAIAGVRHPFMQYSAEPDLPPEKLSQLDSRQIQWHALAQAYQRRWQPVAAAKAKFDSHLLEVEAVWGRELLAKAEPLSPLVAELLWTIQDHLDAKNPSASDEERDRDEIKKRREIMFELGGKHNDEYKKRLEQTIAEIEGVVRPHVLSRHR